MLERLPHTRRSDRRRRRGGHQRSEADDVKASIKNVREITESVKTLIGTSRVRSRGPGSAVRSSVDRLQSTLDNLDKTMKNMETVTDRLKRGEGTVGRLLTDDTIANNVEEITEDAGQPSCKSSTRLQTIVGLRTEYNVLANTVKSYLAIQLDAPARQVLPDRARRGPARLPRAEDPHHDRQVRGRTVATETEGDDCSERLRFSLMFGKRVGLVTGRFGIKESTGGLGRRPLLLDDRLTLSVDVFDARTNRYPRVKGSGA